MMFDGAVEMSVTAALKVAHLSKTTTHERGFMSVATQNFSVKMRNEEQRDHSRVFYRACLTQVLNTASVV